MRWQVLYSAAATLDMKLLQLVYNLTVVFHLLIVRQPQKMPAVENSEVLLHY